MLRTRLVMGLVSLLLLLVGVGTYAVWTAHELGFTVTAKVVSYANGVVAAQKLSERVDRLGGYLRQRRAGPDVVSEKKLEEEQARFLSELREESTGSSSDRRRSDLLSQIGAEMDRLITRINSGQAAMERPLEQMKGDETVLFAVARSIEALENYDMGELRKAEQNARVVTARTTTVFAVGVGMAVVLAGFFAWKTSAALLGPIKDLTASAVALGDGQLDREVPVNSGDELGELARTFNIMAAKLREYRDVMTKEAQHALRTMEATLTSTPDPLFVVAADGRHTVRNPAARELAAMKEFGQGFPESLDRELAQVLATGQHYVPTDYGRVITIRDRHYLPRVLAIGDQLSNFRGAAVILQDVTKFRLLDDAKSNLVGTVSHELKTPLTSLRLSVYLLLEEQVGPLTPTQRELLDSARDDADRLLRILNDLLDISKLESGMTAPDLQPVSVAALLNEMAAEVKPILTAESQTVTVSVGSNVPLEVPVDRDRIRHVFINFLSNASKHSPRGSEIELYATAAPDNSIRFGVRDAGTGIAEENLARVFDKFYRVPGQTQKGAGLGLTIAREIVSTHNGTIACVNRPDGGCDFHFFIPLG